MTMVFILRGVSERMRFKARYLALLNARLNKLPQQIVVCGVVIYPLRTNDTLDESAYTVRATAFIDLRRNRIPTLNQHR
jgi:hypothetical protein